MFNLKAKNQSRKRIQLLVGILLALLFIIILTRIYAAMVLRQNTSEQAMPVVTTITAKHGPKMESISLPGTIRAWHEAPVYARINGYIKQWYVDIGDKIKAGGLMAVIEAPEVDAQLRQAEASVQVITANYKLAVVTAERWVNLLKTDSVSKQETDEKVDAATALKASLQAAIANRDRLRDLVNFEKVIAPFSGIISARATDIGALINAGSNPSVSPLFRIVQTDPLRLYVKIPETYVSLIKTDMSVRLSFAEYPGIFFPAKLFQAAGAIDPTTRTLLVQFTVDNKAGKLLPGSYTTVQFNWQLLPEVVRIPVNTLIFQAAGLQVATLDKANKVVLKCIKISRDFGDVVEIDSGIKAGEAIIINPSDSIYNGQAVRLAGNKNALGKKL